MKVFSDTLLDLTCLWRSILPETVYLSYGTLDENFPILSGAESASVGVVNSARMLELRAGRMHARNVLSSMNIFDVDITMSDSNKAPVWPVLVKGSITHTQYLDKSHVAVAAAWSSQFNAIGIDAEWNMPIHPDLWEYFLTKEELNCVIQEPIVERNMLVSQIWCLKEAAIKAAGGGSMCAWRVLKQSTSIQNGTFNLSLENSGSGFEWIGRAAYGKNIIVAAVCVV